jgi:hypothetical protein
MAARPAPRPLRMRARSADVLDREIQLVFVPFGVAAELAAAVSQHAEELNIVKPSHRLIETEAPGR